MKISVNGIYSNGAFGKFRVERKILYISDGEQDKEALIYMVIRGEERGLCFKTTINNFSNCAKEKIHTQEII
ncbi:hypothetical protein DFP93_13123 [Aneurinibacillus soli]|uniref:Uncharacterized protein n=1 Tax=Aneurinibacillus soli TaxID=1500254 RepID=A0A0U5B393_9BACL|nr:hypothetical protein [Aneurinibacillus soli]PYE57386.1 hypothetical protein DFP93_13123 [Aneurinibacillus soli]BAU28784.1 hypothetical protein CB4_02961 [Aneurinibacillus soli]